MNVAEEITATAHGMGFSDIPAPTVRRAKLFFIDTLGVALAGRNAEGVENVARLVAQWGGKPEATMLFSGRRAPCHMAALVNALMAHARDYDDLHEAGGAHVNVSVVPAALAAAQRQGRVSGKALLTAVILGVDLVCRLGASLPIFRGWHVTSTFGVFGAALGAGKILGLSPERLGHALGIAYSQAGGTRQGRLEGTLTKRLQPALASQSGIMAALLAEAGVSGPKAWIEGTWGIARVYSEGHLEIGPEVMDRLRNGLGKVFLGDELSFKLYPCCKVTHTSIEVTLDQVEEHRIRPEEVEAVIVRVSPGAYQTVGAPFQIRSNPQVDAQFSIPYTVALAMVRNKVGLEGFEEAVVCDPLITAMARRVRVEVDPRMKDVSENVVNLAAEVTIRTARGEFCKGLDICKGHPDRMLDEGDILQKFRECCRYGGLPPGSAVEDLLTLLCNLEEVGDIEEIFTRMRAAEGLP
jgi:2-methylcitrate dehydratase PrpD